MAFLPNVQACVRNGGAQASSAFGNSVPPVPVGARRQVGNSFIPGAGPSISCPLGTWPWTQQLVCPQLCQQRESPRQVRCTRVPMVPAPRSMLCPEPERRPIPSGHFRISSGLEQEAGEKPKSGEPVPCPVPGTAPGTAPGSPAAGADRRCAWDPSGGRAASGAGLGAEGDRLAGQGQAGKDVFVLRTSKLRVHSFYRGKKNVSLGCLVTRAPRAVAPLGTWESHCAPLPGGFPLSLAAGQSRPQPPAPSAGAESGSHLRSTWVGPEPLSPGGGSWRRLPGMGTVQTPGRVQDLEIQNDQ